MEVIIKAGAAIPSVPAIYTGIKSSPDVWLVYRSVLQAADHQIRDLALVELGAFALDQWSNGMARIAGQSRSTGSIEIILGQIQIPGTVDEVLAEVEVRRFHA